MLDLIIRNANLPDDREGFDIGLAGGKITAIEKRLEASAGEQIDATGRLVSPPSATHTSTWMQRSRLGCPA
jgi:cytosine deaminase